MATKNSKIKRINDIADMLEAGLERREIIQKLSKTFKGNVRTIDFEIRDAKVIVEERNKAKEEARLKAISKKTMNLVEAAIISDIEIEAILSNMVRGNMTVEEILRSGVVIRDLTPTEIIAAANTLYKKRGSFAPVRTDTTVKVVKLGKDLEDEDYV